MNNKISILTNGIYQFFDYANELNKTNNLVKIYCLKDFLRILKWKKSVALFKINTFKFFFSRKKLEYLQKKILKDSSNIIISHPGICEKVFSKTKKFKILDLNHFNWDDYTVKIFKKKKINLKYFNIYKPLNGKKFIMERTELKKRLPKKIFKKINFNNIEKTIIECELADMVRVPTKNTYKSLIAAGFPRKKIQFMPYGFDEKIFYPNLSIKKNFIIYASTVSYRKGWPSLKELMLLWNNYNYEFVIIGGIQNEIKNDFFNTLKLCKNVKYFGQPFFQETFANYLRKACLKIFPSYFEGFGLTVLQSLACGTPVISSYSSCAPDLIKNNYNGLLFNHYDMSIWMDQIYKILEDKKKMKTMCINSSYSVKKLKWKNYINKTL